MDQRTKDILDAPYFHTVFTIPEELRMLIYQNQSRLYSLMYQTVAETLFELSSDPKHLGAQPGFFSILHTWGENLHYHPHIHTVILAGGLTPEKRWRKSREKYFIPVEVLADKFRGKFLFYLKKHYRLGQLHFYGDLEDYQMPSVFQKCIDQCYAKRWYVYAKEPFSGPQSVVTYLGRYTHRIAISNQRILSINKETVTIKGKMKTREGKCSTVTLTGIEFIRRFLMHVLPKGFVKIRHYGILANRNKKTKLKWCRLLTMSRNYKPKFEGMSSVEILSILSGRDMTLCTRCKKGHLVTSTESVP